MNLTPTRPSEFSDPTEIGGKFSPTKSLLWRMFYFLPVDLVTSSNQYNMYQTANPQDKLTQSRYTEVPSLQNNELMF